MLLRLIVIAAGISVLPLAAFSQSSCIPPSRPACLTAALTFGNDHFFKQCQEEMQTYRESVVEYGDCLSRWVDKVTADARQDQEMATWSYEKAVEYWNCKTTKTFGCYIF
jgi:hypothetical protein